MNAFISRVARSLALSGALAAGLTPLLTTAAHGHSEFLEQCQNPKSKDISATIKAIQDYYDVEDCRYLKGLLDKAVSLNLAGEDLVDLSPIKEFNRLQMLYVGKNKISDFSFLEGKTQLRSLSIFENSLTDLNEILKHGLKLWDLSVGGNPIEDIALINQFTELRSLYLGKLGLASIDFLKLEHLQRLSVTDNQLKDIAHLSTLKNLSIIDLSHNQISDLSPLTQLPKLDKLTATHNKIASVEPLAKVPALLFASLADNQITDISPLSGHKALGVLWLERNRITQLPAMNAPNLRRLTLDGNAISNPEILAEFQTPNLIRLNLAKAGISALPSGDYLSKLYALQISGNQISSLEFARQMQRVQFFYADDNKVTDLSPLKELRFINGFKLAGNPLGTTVAKTAENCPTDAKSRTIADWCAKP